MTRTIVIAPDSFKGTIAAADAAREIAAGWREERPDDDIRLLPMADGGEGTLEAFAARGPRRGARARARHRPGRPRGGHVLAPAAPDARRAGRHGDRRARRHERASSCSASSARSVPTPSDSGRRSLPRSRRVSRASWSGSARRHRPTAGSACCAPSARVCSTPSEQTRRSAVRVSHRIASVSGLPALPVGRRSAR